MIKLFTGFDPREAVGWHVFAASVLARCSLPVSFMPLTRAFAREGSNNFTFTRFLIPYLLRYEGWALFVDGCDMLCRADLAELWKQRDPKLAAQVVKHTYRTRHPRKYIGTAMECDNADYERKNWASVMLINAGHPQWKGITPRIVQDAHALYLLELRFLDDAVIGALDPKWNWLVDEFDDAPEAKLLHWTAGIPAFPAYALAPASDEWFATFDAHLGANATLAEEKRAA